MRATCSATHATYPRLFVRISAHASSKSSNSPGVYFKPSVKYDAAVSSVD